MKLTTVTPLQTTLDPKQHHNTHTAEKPHNPIHDPWIFSIRMHTTKALLYPDRNSTLNHIQSDRPKGHLNSQPTQNHRALDI